MSDRPSDDGSEYVNTFYGHDRYVFNRPWLTITLIVLNVIAFAASAMVETKTDAAFDAAVESLISVHSEYPDARLTRADLARAPDRLRPILRRLTRCLTRSFPPSAPTRR